MYNDRYMAANTHPMQSPEWEGAINKEGTATVRIFENPLLSYVMMMKKIPFTDLKIGYVLRSTIPSKAGLLKIKEEAEKQNCIFVKFEFDAESISSSIEKMFTLSNKLLYDCTPVMDLTKSQPELFGSLSSMTRRNVTTAKRKGITIRELTNTGGFDMFYKLYKETTVRKKYDGKSHAFFKELYQLAKGTFLHILVAFYKDIPLAAYMLFLVDGTLYYPFGGTANKFDNFKASHLLMWESVLFGKKMGAGKFDMWGCLAQEEHKKNHSWYGLTRFKKGFGGREKRYVKSLDLIINKKLYEHYSYLHVYSKHMKKSGVLILDKNFK